MQTLDILIIYTVIGFLVSLWAARVMFEKDEDRVVIGAVMFGSMWIIIMPLFIIERFYTWVNRLGR